MLLDSLKQTLSLAVTATGYHHRLEVVIETKAASEAKALANAVTPEMEEAQASIQAELEALTAKMMSSLKLHEAAAGSTSATATPAAGATTAAGTTGVATPATSTGTAAPASTVL